MNPILPLLAASTLVSLLALTTLVALFTGDPERRAAALAVLGALLDLLRPWRRG